MAIIFRNGVPYGGTGGNNNFVTGISIEVKSREEKKLTLGARVYGRGRFNSEVTWELTGNHAQGTTINNGVVIIDPDETAEYLTVTAKSVEDPEIFSVAQLIQMDLVAGEYIVSDFTLLTSEPKPSYDEECITLVELDSNDNPTAVSYKYTNLRDAAIKLLQTPAVPYLMHIGDTCTFMDQIPDNAFNRAYANQNYGINGNYDNLHSLYTGFTHSIGKQAFQECYNLKSVEFKQVVVINSSAFLHCMIESLDFPSTLMAIYDGAFTQQGSNTADFNKSLKSITFHEGLTALYASAFHDNDGLNYVELQSTLNLGQSAFNSCNFIEVIRLHKSEMPSGFDLNGNSGCGCVVLDWDANLRTTKIDADGELMSGHPEDVVEWDTVEHIRAYLNGYSMYGTTPPQTVQVDFLTPQSILGTVFAQQSRVQRATFASGISSIPDGMFYDCYDLESVEIPDTVTSIGANTFIGADSLTQIVIHQPKNSIPGAPWGAPHLTASDVVWTG